MPGAVPLTSSARAQQRDAALRPRARRSRPRGARPRPASPERPQRPPRPHHPPRRRREPRPRLRRPRRTDGGLTAPASRATEKARLAPAGLFCLPGRNVPKSVPRRLPATRGSHEMRDVSTAARDRRIAEALLPALIAAGEAILAVRRRGVTVETKADASPVTEADRAAEAVILEHLARGRAGRAGDRRGGRAPPGVIPERRRASSSSSTRSTAPRSSSSGGNDFTVNIGLDPRRRAGGRRHRSAPATGTLYAGVVGDGAWRARGRRRRARRAPADPRSRRAGGDRSTSSPAARTGRRRPTPISPATRSAHLVSAGSSLKFCAVADGEADLYPRMGTTMQWDTAAGDAILRAAGGKVVTLDGAPLPYGPNGAAGAAGLPQSLVHRRRRDRAGRAECRRPRVPAPRRIRVMRCPVRLIGACGSARRAVTLGRSPERRATSAIGTWSATMAAPASRSAMPRTVPSPPMSASSSVPAKRSRQASA